VVGPAAIAKIGHSGSVVQHITVQEVRAELPAADMAGSFGHPPAAAGATALLPQVAATTEEAATAAPDVEAAAASCWAASLMGIHGSCWGRRL